MDGMLALIVIIGSIISMMNKKKKKPKAKKAVTFQQENSAQRRAQRLEQMRAELEKRRAEIAAQPYEALRELAAAGEGESAAAGTEQVEGVSSGSLMAESTEGECLCDPDLEHGVQPAPAAESVYAGEIGKEPPLDLSARGIVQGFVMGEILTRPTQRRTGRR